MLDLTRRKIIKMVYLCTFFAVALAHCAFKSGPGMVRPFFMVLCLMNTLAVGQGVYENDPDSFTIKPQIRVHEGRYKGP